MPTDANETNSFEAKLIRKLRWRLIPFLFFLYVISFIDPSNISIAALTMNKDLAISSEQFGWVAGVFFFGYVLSGIPSNLMLHRFGARLWITVILILWGTLALMMGLVQSELERERRAKQEAKPIGTLQALTIFRVWHAGLIVFATNCGVYMLTFWMPQLIKFVSRGISNTAVGSLVMIPHAAGLVAMVFISRSSDKRLERRFHAAIPALFAGAAMA